MNMEEYGEFCSIYQLKPTTAENMVLWSLEIRFMHMMVKFDSFVLVEFCSVRIIF